MHSNTRTMLAVGLQHIKGRSGRFKDGRYFSPVLALDCEASSSNAACGAHGKNSKGTQ